jgi:hypothetical protein
MAKTKGQDFFTDLLSSRKTKCSKYLLLEFSLKISLLKTPSNQKLAKTKLKKHAKENVVLLKSSFEWKNIDMQTSCYRQKFLRVKNRCSLLSM